MVYKNLSRTTKTYFGVTFKPGDVLEVPGRINDSNFISVSSDLLPKPAKNEKRNGKQKQIIKEEEIK